MGLYSRPVSQMLGVNCCSLGGVSRSTPPWFLLVPKGNQRKPRETTKCQGKPRNTKENHGKSSNTKENQREPRKIKGNQGKPKKTKENQWKPRKIKEKQRTNQCKSKKSKENHGKSREAQGKSMPLLQKYRLDAYLPSSAPTTRSETFLGTQIGAEHV